MIFFPDQAMTDSDEEVIVNITCQLCKNCDKVFDNQQQLQMHDKECTPGNIRSNEQNKFNNYIRKNRVLIKKNLV